jgi:LuxR family maltose regulon positive regulatory protein
MWHIVLHQAACQTRLHLWVGELETAERWAGAGLVTHEHNLPGKLPLYLREVQLLSLARVALALGELDEVLVTLAEVLSGAEPTDRMAHVIEALLLRALALQLAGETSPALEALGRSLVLGESEGYLRLYLEAGEPLRKLLAVYRSGLQARTADRPHANQVRLLQYAERLLAAFAELGTQSALHPRKEQQFGIQGLVEPLTRRELEVLQLVCEGLSNRQIAERLTITLNTVKKHTSNVYGKLAVGSRAQAIVRARDLRLC